MCDIIRIMVQKLCAKCNKIKDINEFGFRSAEKDGYNYYCKSCHNEKARIYRKIHPEETRKCVENYRKLNPEKVKDSQLRIKYGISLDKLNELIYDQGGKCFLCKVEFSKKWDERPAIDHDHSCCSGAKTCGKCIRKILCIRCNAWLGRFENNPKMFLEAFNYLRTHDYKTTRA